MAASTTPVFTITPASTATLLGGTANTSRITFATGYDIYPTTTNGSLIDGITINAVGVTTAGVVRLWIHDGSSYFLMAEILVTANTPSTSNAIWSYRWVPPGGQLKLPLSYKLGATQHNAASGTQDQFVTIIDGGQL